MKYTGCDFWINLPLTDIITGGMGRTQPLIVTFDTFTQYDGWSRCFCYLPMWGEYVRTCRATGVQAINAWGDWSPGCNFPDYDPGYLRNPDGSPQRKDHKPQGWAGYWNDYRMFTRGFTAGQSNAYLLARLAWDPDADVYQIARDFCTIHLGPANAQAAADALMQTQQAWREHYIGKHIRPTYMKWTMVLGFFAKDMEQAYQQWPMDQMLASNARGLKAIDAMERAFARTDRTKAKDPKVYDRFADGIVETALFVRSLHLYREYWWRGRADRDLIGDAQVQNGRARQAVRAELLSCSTSGSDFRKTRPCGELPTAMPVNPRSTRAMRGHPGGRTAKRLPWKECSTPSDASPFRPRRNRPESIHRQFGKLLGDLFDQPTGFASTVRKALHVVPEFSLGHQLPLLRGEALQWFFAVSLFHAVVANEEPVKLVAIGSGQQVGHQVTAGFPVVPTPRLFDESIELVQFRKDIVPNLVWCGRIPERSAPTRRTSEQRAEFRTRMLHTPRRQSWPSETV